MTEIHTAFRRGATVLAEGQSYGAIHREMGLLEPDWNLLTREEHWTPAESRQVRSILANVVEVALTIAGMPAVPLPGQYVAAVIAICVAPANRLVACQKVPETFDAVAASGLHQDFEVRPMRVEQMMSLVIAYSGGLGGEPAVGRLAPEVVSIVKKESEK
jgi:hypothetical protein